MALILEKILKKVSFQYTVKNSKFLGGFLSNERREFENVLEKITYQK